MPKAFNQINEKLDRIIEHLGLNEEEETTAMATETHQELPESDLEGDAVMHTSQPPQIEHTEDFEVEEAPEFQTAGDADFDNAEVDATDAARELADEEGLDLRDVEGTGADGRVTKGDVESYLKDQEG